MVKKSLAGYRANPAMLVPPFAAFAVSTLTSALLPMACKLPPAVTPSLLMAGFGVLFLTLAVNFLALLGQVEMAVRVVPGGQGFVGRLGRGH